ncbi:MAG: hypothetical protein RLZZ200_511 [Pseudomonadota bacterium]|jgi:DNA repair exonuclease SbcCD ATPase subunit
MKIIGLQVENFKRLVAVNIKPDRSLVEIRGRNGQGKTSVLDAIWAALGGKAAAPIKPVRAGAEEARISMDLGELKILRVFKNGSDGTVTTSLSVTAADGARYGSPQTMLDKLVGALSFDPLEFTRIPAKGQFDQLKQLVPGVDFDKLQRQHEGDMEARRDINRRAKDARSAAGQIVLPSAGPFEAVDESALVAELEQAGETNIDLQRRQQNRANAVELVATKGKEADALDARVATLLEEVEELKNRAETKRAEALELQEKIANAEPLPDPVDTTAIRGRIDAARRANETAKLAQTKADHIARAVDLEKQADEITVRIDQRQAGKIEAIAAANIPVPGISFGDGEILLNGVPFNQGSDAEQLRASIAIAAAMNPELRVIRVRDGSLLDADSLKLVAEFAEANDLQVWAEIVDSKGETGILIEDGAIRSVKASEAGAAA